MPLNKILSGFFFALGWLPIVGASQENPDALLDMSFDELLNTEIQVASNVLSDIRKQPVSVSTIDANTIRLSSARTLSELLTLYVPGYFLVEDQDDTIAGFRGVVADNNSKTLLMINGVSLNTEWFWGAPDALLNGMDLSFIERIEVIRGPGSVTLGQGALIGVINIVTKSPTKNTVNVAFSAGENEALSASFEGSYVSQKVSAYFYAGVGDYDGQAMPNIGWHAEHRDQGLTVFQREHRLKRADYRNFYGSISGLGFDVEAYHFQQKRDLYSFYRDREVVEQRITGVTAGYQFDISDEMHINVSTRFTQDEYALYSHGNNSENASRLQFELATSGFAGVLYENAGFADGLVTSGLKMGGTRENRAGIKVVANWLDIWNGHSLAIGAEYSNFAYGENDADGDNYILNEEVQRVGLISDLNGGFQITGNLNAANTWVKPDSFGISSLFVEDVYQLDEALQAFWAVRYDNHPNWGSQFSPRLGVMYQLDSQHALRLSWQTGFRGAVGVQYSGGFVQDGLLAQENFDTVNSLAITQVDFDFDGIAANDNKTLRSVAPEKLASAELAYSYYTDQRSINAVVYINEIEDILSAEAHGYEDLAFGDAVGTDIVGTWNGNWYYQNQIGALKQVGLELEFEQRFSNAKLNLSHAMVRVLSADQSVEGIYVNAQDQHVAYPENVSRLRFSYEPNWQTGTWSVLYSMLYYWDYYSPLGDKRSGEEISHLGVNWQPRADSSLQLALHIKNLWDSDGLYPIKATGDITGSDGVAVIEGRTWWITAEWTF